MLFVSVSILSAQTTDVPTAPVARFNYQAVVRDQNHDFNLVMNEAVKVTVEIIQDGTAAYTTTLDGMTNRNGMVSFIIGEKNPIPANINWNNATIKATFKDAAGATLSDVINPVMPVPLALQSVQDPLEITTDKIVEYLNSENTTGEDVGQIVTALFNNAPVSKAVKDSIVSYIKSEPATVKDLALYFIANASVQDAKDAYNEVTPEVKQKLKQMLVDSIKDNKKLAYEIAEYYLTNTTKAEVNDLWSAARENPQFHDIFNAVRDSAIAYVMNHKELMMTVAEYYIKNVLKYQDVQEIYAALRNDNPVLYTQLKNKFDSYLESYIGDTYVKACDGVSVCDLKHTLDSLKALTPSPTPTSDCPTIVSATSSRTYGNNENQVNFTVIMSDDATANFLSLEIKTLNNGNIGYPQGNMQWVRIDLGGGMVKFVLSGIENGDDPFTKYKVHYQKDNYCDVESDEYQFPNE